MELDRLGPKARDLIQEVAGYLNFSSGASDVRFLRAINELFGMIAESGEPRDRVWRTLAEVIRAGLVDLAMGVEAFRHADQAMAVLRLVFDEALPAYRRFHRDLLFHQTDEALFQPFFLGRVCEAVLAMGPPWEDTQRIVDGAIRRLNDFVGYRPVAVLRSEQKMQPYAHEWVRPIPLYIRGAGIAWGRYRELLALALEILRATDEDLLREAWFDPEAMDELALDPRAYDFDHPVNRRPNYHFGTWDLHLIDNRGRYRRFVLQQVTLDGLFERIEQRVDLPRAELLWEAAAVLACTMLMSSGVTGDGPEAIDSTFTLGKLVVRIASFRDAFYERWIRRLEGPHARRLRAEAETLRQPFGGVRHHLNQALARRRAEQLQRVHLARLFAKMGYLDAAARQAAFVPAASARMRSQIDCRLTAAHQAIDRRQLAEAVAKLPEIADLLHRAIECGAMVDPWNMLGFGGQFSRSPAIEDSIHDERVEELIEVVGDLFNLHARLQAKAAAAGDETIRREVCEQAHALARWWDQFASTEVSGINGFSGHEECESADQVAEALGAWHQAGTAAGNVAFWRRHAERFRSPKAYAMLVEALLDENDLVAAMALLVHWLSQAGQVPLAHGRHVFGNLVARWMRVAWHGRQAAGEAGAAAGPRGVGQGASDPWPLARKMLDYLEANAESYWQVPRLQLGGPGGASHRGRTRTGGEEASALDPLGEAESGAEEPWEDAGAEEPDDLNASDEDLFRAAYEGVVYRDSTDDGFEGEMLEGPSPATDFELVQESERISQHLMFLLTVARLWKSVAVWSMASPAPERDEVLLGYAAQAKSWCEGLGKLLDAVHRYPIPLPRGTHDSLVEFDRRRVVKETLLERIVATLVEVADAAALVPMVTSAEPPDRPAADWELLARRTLRALYHGQIEFARGIWPRLRQALARQPLLYLPLVRGGHPRRLAQARGMHQWLRRLLVAFPQCGLIQETSELLKTIQRMERNHPVGPAAVTEFDRLFEIAATGVLQCAIASASEAALPHGRGDHDADAQLVALLDRPIEVLLKRWLSHSRNVRVSSLEVLFDEQRWQEVRKFIKRYGHDLFTQEFLTTYSKLRAILHEGAGAYLDALAEDCEDEEKPRLLRDLGGPLPRDQAIRCLEICLEAIVENYSEYLDYNSTTTQSDRGEMLYVLLDFLRVQASYESVAWNLKPVLLAHDALMRAGRTGAARRWREAVAERTAGLADDHQRRFDRLVANYGVRLRTVADRIAQRFVQPLAVNRLCALVRPAVEELRAGRPLVSFAELERELAPFTAEPGGIGYQLPPWLDALDRAVERVQAGGDEFDAPLAPPMPQVKLPLKELQRQINAWDRG